jgi:hypothetical protein
MTTNGGYLVRPGCQLRPGLDKIAQRLTSVEAQLSLLAARLDSIEARLDRLLAR